jgi:hypothetical protein
MNPPAKQYKNRVLAALPKATRIDASVSVLKINSRRQDYGYCETKQE